MLNLSVLLEDSARKYPTKDAFIFMDTHLSYAEINAAANQIANGLLSMGIEKGDKIALSCLNLPYFPMIYFGILKAGGVIVPLSVLLKRDEIEYHLNDSDAKAYFCFTGTADLPMGEEGHAGFQNAALCKHFFMITAKPSDASTIAGTATLGSLMNGQSPIAPSVTTGAEDTALIIYTSGTTGKPKGAELTHANLVQNAILSSDLFRLGSEDNLLIVLPLFHIFGMTCLMNAGMYRGTTNVLLPRFDADAVLKLMQKQAISVFAGVPTMYWGLLNHDDNTFDIGSIAKTLRLCISGGASLPVKVLEDFEAKFKVAILEGYGMSEGSPVVTFNQIDVGRKAGSIGKEVWGVAVKLVNQNNEEVPVGEKGELLYKGHNVMKGYYKKPAATQEALKDGWMHSGDIAVKDEDGFYYIVDRTKDMIIRGGLNVYPREVEEVLMNHEAISLVAVIGVPDEKLGEEIKACVVLKDGVSITEDDLMEWTKAHIASYKYPRLIEILTALPMTATGKILKKELRKQ
ncbi:MAG: long-chain fatty acid--CoA ligase [Flavobacteriaceae bacterium]